MLQPWIRAYRLVFGLLAFTAAVFNLNHFNDPKLWSHFTYQSNFLAGAVLVLGATVFARYINPGWWDVVRGVSVISILVTGIVYAVLLEGLYNPFTSSQHNWASSVMHQLIPIVMLLDIIIVPLAPRTPRWSVVFYLLYPLAYLGWFLLRGPHTGYYPYDFINPDEYSNGYTGVLITCGALLLVFVVIGLAIIGYSRVRRTTGILRQR